MSTNTNKLWTFGCSFTQSLKSMANEYTGGGDYHIFQKYINDFLHGECPPSWPDILSEKLSLNLKNKGRYGSSNETIFSTFINHFSQIKPGDVVIIEWTFLSRFRTPNIKNEWIDVQPNIKIIEESIINQQCIDQILVARERKLYFEEICKLSEFLYEISKSVGFDFYIWHLFDVSYFGGLREYEKKYNLDWEQSILHTAKTEHDKVYDDMFSIENATKGKINDGHLSKEGHEFLAEMIYKDIIKPKIDKIL